jgi:antitoxin component YwqK of YwqJK toxin-antitoxin module
MKTAWILAAALSLGEAGAPAPAGHPDRLEYRFYRDGRVESVRAYVGEKKVGTHRGYWSDGTPRFEAQYEEDAYHGEYRTWYASGQPYERRHFDHGRESGLQQSWTETGELFLNYEVRGGRRYGLVNARPCVPVKELKR